jgi:hypothetical protein
MRLCGVIASAVAAAVLAPGAIVADAAPAPGSAVTITDSAAVSARPVLTSPYGEARSRVKGTWGRAGTVRGWFVPRRFDNQNGELVAIGRLHAVLVRPNGTVRGVADKRITIPVRRIEGERVGARLQPESCQILNLILGPLDLNLLGLEVHLNRVVLNIEATPGPGNLLGNLLCAVAGLLDNTGVLREIRRILNSVLAILRL